MNDDPVKDLAAISQIVVTPNVLAVPLELPVRSVQDPVALVRATPGKYTLRLRRHRNAPPSGKRTVQADGQARPAARALPQSRLISQIDGCNSIAVGAHIRGSLS
jgi:Tripartite tricarboxylate transporter family receptor